MQTLQQQGGTTSCWELSRCCQRLYARVNHSNVEEAAFGWEFPFPTDIVPFLDLNGTDKDICAANPPSPPWDGKTTYAIYLTVNNLNRVFGSVALSPFAGCYDKASGHFRDDGNCTRPASGEHVPQFGDEMCNNLTYAGNDGESWNVGSLAAIGVVPQTVHCYDEDFTLLDADDLGTRSNFFCRFQQGTWPNIDDGQRRYTMPVVCRFHYDPQFVPREREEPPFQPGTQAETCHLRDPHLASATRYATWRANANVGTTSGSFGVDMQNVIYHLQTYMDQHTGPDSEITRPFLFAAIPIWMQQAMYGSKVVAGRCGPDAVRPECRNATTEPCWYNGENSCYPNNCGWSGGSCYDVYDAHHQQRVDVVVVGNCGIADDYDGDGNNIKWCTPMEFPSDGRGVVQTLPEPWHPALGMTLTSD